MTADNKCPLHYPKAVGDRRYKIWNGKFSLPKIDNDANQPSRSLNGSR
jgi:hypothetical protein